MFSMPLLSWLLKLPRIMEHDKRNCFPAFSLKRLSRGELQWVTHFWVKTELKENQSTLSHLSSH